MTDLFGNPITDTRPAPLPVAVACQLKPAITPPVTAIPDNRRPYTIHRESPTVITLIYED